MLDFLVLRGVPEIRNNSYSDARACPSSCALDPLPLRRAEITSKEKLIRYPSRVFPELHCGSVVLWMLGAPVSIMLHGLITAISPSGNPKDMSREFPIALRISLIDYIV